MHLFVKTGQKLASNSRHMIELGALEGSFLFYLGLNLILSTNCNSFSFPIFSHLSNRVFIPSYFVFVLTISLLFPIFLVNFLIIVVDSIIGL